MKRQTGPTVPRNFYKLLQHRTFRLAREKVEQLREEGVACEGWLAIQVGKVDHYVAWKTRWFILSQLGRMVYLSDEPGAGRVQLKGQFEIGINCRICMAHESLDMTIETLHKTYRLKAGSDEERNMWLGILRPMVMEGLSEIPQLVTRGPAMAFNVTYYHVLAPEGVAYRLTANFKDRVKGMRGPEYGDVVEVTEVRGNFARHKNGYWLPIVKGERVILTNEDLRSDMWEQPTQRFRKISHTLPPIRSPLLTSLLLTRRHIESTTTTTMSATTSSTISTMLLSESTDDWITQCHHRRDETDERSAMAEMLRQMEQEHLDKGGVLPASNGNDLGDLYDAAAAEPEVGKRLNRELEAKSFELNADHFQKPTITERDDDLSSRKARTSWAAISTAIRFVQRLRRQSLARKKASLKPKLPIPLDQYYQYPIHCEQRDIIRDPLPEPRYAVIELPELSPKNQVTKAGARASEHKSECGGCECVDMLL